MAKDKLPNHIDEYFNKIEGTKQQFHSRELFRADKEDVDIKTDLEERHIIFINTLLWNDLILASHGLDKAFNDFVNTFMRLRISFMRKSRGEFVQINQTPTDINQASSLLSNFSNITNSKK